jgi:hypothetical protein
MLFLSLRVIHMLLAAIWIGAAALLTFVVLPAIEDAGQAGNATMAAMARQGLVVLMAVLGGMTALTGLVLFWHFTGGFDPEISRSHAGMAFGIGGAFGLLATILGASVTGRSAKKMIAAIEKAAAAPEGPARAALVQEAASHRARVLSSGRIGLLFMIIAMVCMAVGHYV